MFQVEGNGSGEKLLVCFWVERNTKKGPMYIAEVEDDALRSPV